MRTPQDVLQVSASYNMGKAVYPVTIQILCAQPDLVYGDLDSHLSHNIIVEWKILKAAMRDNAVSVLDMDVGTSAHPLASYPSTTQNDFNLSMAHDHDSDKHLSQVIRAPRRMISI